MALEVGAAAVQPDRPADDRTDRVADRSGQRHRDVCGEPLVDLHSEEHDVLAGERARCHGARVHHDHLARRREDGVDEHQEEDRVQAVVADRRRDGVGQLAEDGGDQHEAGLY